MENTASKEIEFKLYCVDICINDAVYVIAESEEDAEFFIQHEFNDWDDILKHIDCTACKIDRIKQIPNYCSDSFPYMAINRAKISHAPFFDELYSKLEWCDSLENALEILQTQKEKTIVDDPNQTFMEYNK